MSKSKKKKKRPWRRSVLLVLFLVTAGFLFWGRHELLWGIQGYLLDRVEFFRVADQSDLPVPADTRPRPAEIVGIPDYKNVLRFPYKDEILTCYRMVDFGNRLCVCTEKGLTRPKAIDEIIKERTIRGRLERLEQSPLEDRLRRVFMKAGSIRLADGAFLLSEDRFPRPSILRVGFLCFCLILCCFSAYRLIKQ
jgi:hypothetical protein